MALRHRRHRLFKHLSNVRDRSRFPLVNPLVCVGAAWNSERASGEAGMSMMGPAMGRMLEIQARPLYRQVGAVYSLQRSIKG
jgi:hypothetical protein